MRLFTIAALAIISAALVAALLTTRCGLASTSDTLILVCRGPMVALTTGETQP